MTDVPNNDVNRRLLNRTGAAVAICLVVILAGALTGIMLYEIPEKNHDIVLILITTVCNAVIGVTGYFFGSSAATTRQGEIIAQQAATQDKLATTAAAAAGSTTTTSVTSP